MFTELSMITTLINKKTHAHKHTHTQTHTHTNTHTHPQNTNAHIHVYTYINIYPCLSHIYPIGHGDDTHKQTQTQTHI